MAVAVGFNNSVTFISMNYKTYYKLVGYIFQIKKILLSLYSIRIHKFFC